MITRNEWTSLSLRWQEGPLSGWTVKEQIRIRRPKPGKSDFDRTLLSSHVITRDSWKAGRVGERGVLRGILEKERRVKGSFRYCSQIGRRAVTLRGKKKKSDRCSRSCVGSTDAHRRRILQVKETNHPVTFTPIFVRQTRLSIRLSHASRKSRLETRPLSPLALVFDRNLWKERKIADRSNSPISRSVSRSNVVE